MESPGRQVSWGAVLSVEPRAKASTKRKGKGLRRSLPGESASLAKRHTSTKQYAVFAGGRDPGRGRETEGV